MRDFRSNADRVRNRKILHEILQRRFDSMRFEEIMEILRRNDIPTGRLNTLKDLLNDELITWDTYNGILIPRLPLPGSLDNQGVPSIGENTLEILRELGYSEDEIENMNKEGVVAVRR